MRLYPEYQKPGYTYFETFTFQGKEYYRNSIVKFKKGKKDAKLIQLVEHYIDESGFQYWTYEIWRQSGHHYSYNTFSTPDEILECIIEPAYPIHVNNKQEYYRDWEVDEVLKGWLIFIVIMALGTFLRDRVTLWIIGSVLFFFWRENKLRKPPEHDYGFDIEEKVREWNG